MKYAGIYIHIPFCAIKCMYCDFYSIADREDSIPKFIEAINKEIEQCEIGVSGWMIDTIFIGGGTPSLIREHHMDSILSCLNKKYDLSNLNHLTIAAIQARLQKIGSKPLIPWESIEYQLEFNLFSLNY